MSDSTSDTSAEPRTLSCPQCGRTVHTSNGVISDHGHVYTGECSGSGKPDPRAVAKALTPNEVHVMRRVAQAEQFRADLKAPRESSLYRWAMSGSTARCSEAALLSTKEAGLVVFVGGSKFTDFGRAVAAVLAEASCG